MLVDVALPTPLGDGKRCRLHQIDEALRLVKYHLPESMYSRIGVVDHHAVDVLAEEEGQRCPGAARVGLRVHAALRTIEVDEVCYHLREYLLAAWVS